MMRYYGTAHRQSKIHAGEECMYESGGNGSPAASYGFAAVTTVVVFLICDSGASGNMNRICPSATYSDVMFHGNAASGRLWYYTPAATDHTQHTTVSSCTIILRRTPSRSLLSSENHPPVHDLLRRSSWSQPPHEVGYCIRLLELR